MECSPVATANAPAVGTAGTDAHKARARPAAPGPAPSSLATSPPAHRRPWRLSSAPARVPSVPPHRVAASTLARGHPAHGPGGRRLARDAGCSALQPRLGPPRTHRRGMRSATTRKHLKSFREEKNKKIHAQVKISIRAAWKKATLGSDDGGRGLLTLRESLEDRILPRTPVSQAFCQVEDSCRQTRRQVFSHLRAEEAFL